MIDLAMLQAVRDFVAIFGVIAGLTKYIFTVRDVQNIRKLSLKVQEQEVETRQAQLFMQIVNHYSQPSMIEAIDLYNRLELNSLEDYLKIWADHEKVKILRRYWSWVEGIGVLVRENYLDIKVIAGLMSGIIKQGWEKKAPYVLEMREAHSFPRLYIEWEYLYNELMKYAEEHPELGIKKREHQVLVRPEG